MRHGIRRADQQNYLRDTAAQSQPFFMVVSLVNPHDVLFYPSSYVDGGYDNAWLDGEIGLPATVHEDLSTKPTVQKQFLRIFNATGPIPTPQMKRNYLNFYGNLMKASDRYLVKILDTLEAGGLLEKTLVVATADHGEMGTAHGGLTTPEQEREYKRLGRKLARVERTRLQPLS